MINSRLTSSKARRRLKVRGSFLLAAGILTLGACDDEPAPTEFSPNAELASNGQLTQVDGRLSRTYEGRDLFRGLLLSDGPVAAALPRDLVQQHERDAAYTRKVAEVIATIERTDPGFFDGFGKQINTGDRHRIASALEDGADRLAIALKLSDEELKMKGNLTAFDPGIGLVLVAPVAVIVWKWKWVYSDIADPSTSPVQREKIVDRVALALGM